MNKSECWSQIARKMGMKDRMMLNRIQCYKKEPVIDGISV